MHLTILLANTAYIHLFFSISYYSVRAPCVLNKIMVTKLDYYSLTQTVELVKLKLIICIIKTFENKDEFDNSDCSVWFD